MDTIPLLETLVIMWKSWDIPLETMGPIPVLDQATDGGFARAASKLCRIASLGAAGSGIWGYCDVRVFGGIIMELYCDVKPTSRQTVVRFWF